VLRYERRRNW